MRDTSYMNLRRLSVSLCASLLFPFGLSVAAQVPVSRLPASIGNGSRVALPDAAQPHVPVANDAGALAADTKINGITLVFSRSAVQESALQTLLAAQANTASPLYHHWLTPDQFASRFGLTDADIASAEGWLQSQGFTILGVGRGRDRISFSGNAAQVASAFGAPLHQFKVDGKLHYAPLGQLTLPAALASTVSDVLHLSSFRPKPPVKVLLNSKATPNFTQASTGAHYLTPGDIATQYDVTSVYNQGFNGAGQSIAVLGQSYINTSDIQHFQTASGIAANLPSLVLVPNSGLEGIDGQGEGDEGESDLDVEYSSSMARGANIFFVYVGNNPNYSIADSVAYAVGEGIAPVLTVSYGVCEIDSLSGVVISPALAEQATAQGQTIVAASGDSGSTGCFGDTDLTDTQQGSLAVQNPANLANVTAVGGVQMAAGTFTAGNTTYFSAATGSDKVSSLLSYVPEVVWNEDSTSYGLLSGGGGVSAIIPRPTWQVGVPGIPAGTNRLVPDVSLQASAGSPGYLVCTSDPFLGGDSTSCASGFEDSATSSVNVVGGTSFAAPIFAGLVAVLNQATHSSGLGNINIELYTLASNAGTYASAFHDITSGSKACTAGPSYCLTAGEAGYSATTGYDVASGLGTIDFANLVKAWPVNTGTGAQTATTTTLTASTLAPASAATDVVTIAVTGTGTTPTGTVAVYVDGTEAAASLALTNGQATYTFPGTTTVGSHIVLAIYSGDTTNLNSDGSISLTVGTTVSAGTFTLAASALSVPANGTGNVTVGVTPVSGYSGVVSLAISNATSSSSTSICYAPAFISTGGGANTGSLEIGVGSVCGTSDARAANSKMLAVKVVNPAKAAGKVPAAPGKRWPAEVAFAGLLVTGCFFRKRSRPMLLAVGLLSFVGLGLSGCGSSNNTVTTPITPVSAGTYTVTITGTDTITSAITSSTTFTLTVQ